MHSHEESTCHPLCHEQRHADIVPDQSRPDVDTQRMDVSKTKTSFYRRLYVAWLIDSGAATSVPALMEATGMPRRTAQDTLSALVELDIDCQFAQGQGERNNAGQYLIRDWGRSTSAGSPATCSRSRPRSAIPETIAPCFLELR